MFGSKARSDKGFRRWEHPIFANILVGAKHFGSKSLVITNKLSPEMLRPFQIEMHPSPFPYLKIIIM